MFKVEIVCINNIQAYGADSDLCPQAYSVDSDLCPQAYGADSDRPLGIPGERLANVTSARQLVGWYNGLPGCRPPLDLGVEHAVIVGMGNVALDVLRLLTAPIDLLKVRAVMSEQDQTRLYMGKL